MSLREVRLLAPLTREDFSYVDSVIHALSWIAAEAIRGFVRECGAAPVREAAEEQLHAYAYELGCRDFDDVRFCEEDS
jgi:hypothetical protein